MSNDPNFIIPGLPDATASQGQQPAVTHTPYTDEQIAAGFGAAKPSVSYPPPLTMGAYILRVEKFSSVGGKKPGSPFGLGWEFLVVKVLGAEIDRDVPTSKGRILSHVPTRPGTVVNEVTWADKYDSHFRAAKAALAAITGLDVSKLNDDRVLVHCIGATQPLKGMLIEARVFPKPAKVKDVNDPILYYPQFLVKRRVPYAELATDAAARQLLPDFDDRVRQETQRAN